jgi:hypothetical protein
MTQRAVHRDVILCSLVAVATAACVSGGDKEAE